MTLQHLRSSTANKRPDPTAMADGQIALNTAASSPGLFYKDSAGNLVKVGPVHVGTTAPNVSPASGGTAGNSVGEQWLDTSGGTYVFKVWDGSAWRSETGTFVDVAGDVMTGALGIIAGSASAPGLYFSGDTNTGIYSPGAEQVAISTNGTARLYIDGSGRIGVNTQTTNVPLTVQADSGQASIRIVGRSSDNISYAEFTDSTQAATYGYFTSGPTYLAAGTGITEAIRINSSGQIGYGDQSFNHDYSFYRATNTTIRLANSTSTTAVNRGALVYLAGSDLTLFNQEAGFLRLGTNGTERLRIDSAGQLQINSLGSAAAPVISFNADPNTGIYSPGADQLALSTNGTERLRIDSSGRVGIGSSVPTELLTVGSDATGNNYIRINSANNTEAGVKFYGDLSTTKGYAIGYEGDGNLFFVRSDSAGTVTDRLVINDSGNVGIGTTDPVEKLEVRDGNIGLDSAGSTVGDRTTERFYKRTDNGSTNGMAAIGMNGAGTNGFLGEIKFYTCASDVFNTSLSERVRIDSSGRLLVGTSSSTASAFSVQAREQLHGTSAEFSTKALFRWSNDVGQPTLNFNKSRGTSVGTRGVVQSADQLGYLSFEGDDGTNFIRAAGIYAEVDGTPGANDMPGRIVLSTTLDGASSPTERLRISSDGRHTINSQAQSGTALSTTAPAKLYTSTGTYTDTATAASGTVTHGTIVAFDNPAIAASNLTVTYTNASTVYIDGAPTAGTNVTVTNPYALYVNAGTSFFGGNVNLSTGNEYRINNTKVVGARVTGWTAATGTATRTTFATSTVTTAQLAERVKALIDDLISHGLIGT